jgi:hypothetical protein
MMVMPANGSYPWLHYWAGRMPGCVGHLYSPGGQREPLPWLPYALDNGAFTGFDEDRWRALLRWSILWGIKPLWAAVPDKVGDPKETSRLWNMHYMTVHSFGMPCAFVVQDGHLAVDVPGVAAVVFVGGSTAWKERTVSYWCEHFPRVHVGRVNGYRMLRRCSDAGAESCDGTGWGRGDKRQLAGLMQFFREEEKRSGSNKTMDKNVECPEKGQETKNADKSLGAAGVRRSA